MGVQVNPYRTRELTDNLLRKKQAVTDDPAWHTDQVDPGAFYGTAGGVADAGNYTITLTPVSPDDPVPPPIVFANTGETLAQTAEGLHDLIQARLDNVDPAYDSVLALYLKRSQYVAAGVVLQVVPLPLAHRFTVTMTGTGGTGTLTLSPDDEYPITGHGAKIRRTEVGPATEVEIIVLSIDASGIPAVDDNTCSMQLQLLRVIDRGSVSPNTITDRLPGVGTAAADTGVVLGRMVRVLHNGGRFGVRMTAIVQVPTAHDHFEVRWREVVA